MVPGEEGAGHVAKEAAQGHKHGRQSAEFAAETRLDTLALIFIIINLATPLDKFLKYVWTNEIAFISTIQDGANEPRNIRPRRARLREPLD